MKEELSIDIIGLAGSYSYALDCIEAELVNIKNKHGKRVAYISICMAEYWKIQGDELQDLYSFRWNIETSYYEQKTFWSLCSYMVRSCKGINYKVVNWCKD